ncbi:MAG: ATP synthase F0 subunit B [Patescibacteria group bacterium]
MSELFATFGINGKLLLMQAVNFGVLLGALSYFLYTPVMRVLDERKRVVEKGVRDAEEAAARLVRSESEGTQIVRSATVVGEGIVATARTRADEKGALLVKDAEGKAEAILKEAHERAAETTRRMRLEGEQEIARAAILAAEKILIKKSV